MSSAVTCIVPALPPTINGVGDYAVRLAHAMQSLGMDSCWVSASDCLQTVEGRPAQPLSPPTADVLESVLSSIGASRVLLHFSGYGYARYGLCYWLERGLRTWKARSGGRIVIIFHEVYAIGPPWRTSFWTGWPQANIAKRLAGISDAAICTSAGGQDQLRHLRPSLNVTLLPVFSNIGELEELERLWTRQPVAVVFGSAVRRKAAYEVFSRLSAATAEGLRRIGVERVLDIGEGIVAPPDLLGLPIKRAGVLSASGVSAALSDARVGLLDYPNHVLTKSGIFAAYLSHGVVAVNSSSLGTLPENLLEGREFVHARRVAETAFNPEAIAAAGSTWYRKHKLERTANVLAQVLA